MILQGKFGKGTAEGKVWLAEKQSFSPARLSGRRDLEQVIAGLIRELLTEQKRLGKSGEFLSFPLEILRDPKLQSGIQDQIKQGHSPPEAITRCFREWEKRLQSIPDPYLRSRSRDLADLRRRLLSQFYDNRKPVYPAHPFVMVSRDLFVTDFLEWKKHPLAGICLEEGNESGHGVMLAKSLGIPVTGGAAGILKQAKKGMFIAVRDKKVYLNEKPKIRLPLAPAPHFEKNFRTKDGTPIVLRANVGIPEELEKAREAGAMGIGLFRTEFLRNSPPEELKIYRKAFQIFSPAPVVFRLPDFGSDKPYSGSGLTWPQEKNPALGWRGLQFLLDHPEILHRRLKVLFAAAEAEKEPLRILLPMVRNLEEIRRFLKISQLHRKKAKVSVKLGIMVETPSALYLLEHLPAEIQFVSLGTNDLLQYFFAVDRTHPTIQADPSHPQFMSFIQEIARKTKRAGKSLSVCGEAAGDPRVLPLLIGLGIREFSLSIPKIPEAASFLRNLSLAKAKQRVKKLFSGRESNEKRRT